jgi:chromosome partitioning protein
MFFAWSEVLRKAQVLSAEVLGVLLTKYEPNTRASREVLAGLQQDGVPLFKTTIPKRTAAERMISGLNVIGDAEADPDLAEAYAHFTVEVMTLINEKRQQKGKHHA